MELRSYLYNKIGLSPCVSTGVTWMDAAGARLAHAASGTSKAGQTKGREDGQADGPNRAMARIYNLSISEI